MPRIIPVKFAYAARDLWFDPQHSEAQEGDHVICATERGTEIGLCTQSPRDVTRQELTRMIGGSQLKGVIRIADEFDLARAESLAERGDAAMPVFRRLVSESDLDMKPVGVEYLFGGEKVVCYFAAEERVDFRQLVRELSRELHERIDMRQIGVREEAAVVGGFGHCGQELCCARFGLSFEPVSIRMAKEQDLPLTSNKISGACGRLMCCLRYEFEAYRDFKGRAPKRNAVIETPLGKAKIVEYDTPKEQLALRLENGKVVRIPLAEMETSDAAKKKACELNCACRPDVVVRASLEKLSSPDVQMALAELDRKNGIIPADELDATDYIEEAKPKRRRGRGKGQGSSQAQAQAQVAPVSAQAAQPAEPGAKKSRRRRRRRSGSEETRAPQAQQPTAQKRPPQAVEESAGQAAEPRRRRRHRSGEGEGAPQAQPQAQAKRTHQTKAEPKPQTRTRRRPGDRAGATAQAQDAGAQAQNQAKAGSPAQERPAEGGSSSSRRRRRRRGGANKQAQGSQGQPQPAKGAES